MTTTITYSSVLDIETCWCGIMHAIPANLARRAREEGIEVYCPLGHKWVITKTDTQRLREQLEQRNQWIANRDEDIRAERASHSITKGKLTKARNRAAKGLCPCCNRSFVNIADHVATKHPDFKP